MDPPRAGDIVEGDHPEAGNVIGRVERTDGRNIGVRDDAGTIWDFNSRPLRVLERWTGSTFTYLGVTYAPNIPRPSRLGRLRRDVLVSA